MTKRVTLLDVAKAAGVSKATASNTFASPMRVKPELRARIEAAARELGFAGPDPKGRMLSSGKVNAIGIVTFGAFGIAHFFKNAYQRDFLAGVADVCDARRVGLSLVSGRDDKEDWNLRNALVDGFVFTRLDQVERLAPNAIHRLPYVVMDIDGAPDIRSVRVENHDGARQATRHLIGLGHRRFVIGAPLWSFQAPIFHPASKGDRRLVPSAPSQLEKLAGVAEALAEIGISIDDVPIVEACGTKEEEDAFGNGAAMLIRMAAQATAVIALSDDLALAILDQAKKLGVSVPRGLSVIGFDDVPAAALADPPLTTVHQSAFENGRVAARILLDGGPPQQAVVPVNLVVRGSTAPPML